MRGDEKLRGVVDIERSYHLEPWIWWAVASRRNLSKLDIQFVLSGDIPEEEKLINYRAFVEVLIFVYTHRFDHPLYPPRGPDATINISVSIVG